MQGTHDPNAKKIMAEEGIMWDLSGRTDSFGETTLTTKKHFIEGEQIPSGFTTHERQWVLELAETHGLDVGIVEEEKTVVPEVPYIEATVRFSHGSSLDDGSTIWSDLELRVNGVPARVELNRSIRTLTLTIEGQSKDEVASHHIDTWVSSTVRHIRRALKAGGFAEAEQLDIDCEVIMGAEREAQCDPDLMRSLLTTDQEREEE